MNLAKVYVLISPIAFLLISLLLGLATPNYNHFEHTISMLAIEKYGFIQQINFIQLAIAFLIMGFHFYQYFSNQQAKMIWSRVFYFCAVFILIETIFPTDVVTHLSQALSLTGFIHFGGLITFFILAPIGIHALQVSMQTDAQLSKLSFFTGLMGYGSAVLSYFWTALFFVGGMPEYLGLFQKLIGIVCFSWLTVINWQIKKN